MCRPAMEPRNGLYPGCRRAPVRGRPYERARHRECLPIRRGRRTWHARKRLAREPGDLTSDLAQWHWPGPHREGEESKPMMYGREKSDSAIVATKPANNAG